jgi:hypothetical protein
VGIPNKKLELGTSTLPESLPRVLFFYYQTDVTPGGFRDSLILTRNCCTHTGITPVHLRHQPVPVRISRTPPDDEALFSRSVLPVLMKHDEREQLSWECPQ